MEIPLERSPIKIAFIGTSCTGKTRLLKHYEDIFKDNPKVVFVPEVAREYFATHPKIIHRFKEPAQTKVQDLVLAREKAAHAQKPSLIFTDRSVLDAVMYVAAAGQMNGAERLFDRVRDWVPTYGHLFLLDPEDIPYQTDDIRTETADQRMLIHQMFLSGLRRWNIPHMLLSGSLEEKTGFIDQVIKRAEGSGFNPVNTLSFSTEEEERYRRQRNEIMYPFNQRASSITYRGPEPLLQFIREGRLGLQSVVRVSDYGWGRDPHYQIVPEGLTPYNFESKIPIFQPEQTLNLKKAPHGWTINS